MTHGQRAIQSCTSVIARSKPSPLRCHNNGARPQTSRTTINQNAKQHAAEMPQTPTNSARSRNALRRCGRGLGLAGIAQSVARHPPAAPLVPARRRVRLPSSATVQVWGLSEAFAQSRRDGAFAFAAAIRAALD